MKHLVTAAAALALLAAPMGSAFAQGYNHRNDHHPGPAMHGPAMHGPAKHRANHNWRKGSHIARNDWGLGGEWTVTPQEAALSTPPGRIAYRFHARDLHLVLGSDAANRPIRFRVMLDGQPPGADHGADVDAQGAGVVRGHRLYQLVRQSRDAIDDRTFEIEFLDPGVRAYAFTFG